MSTTFVAKLPASAAPVPKESPIGRFSVALAPDPELLRGCSLHLFRSRGIVDLKAGTLSLHIRLLPGIWLVEEFTTRRVSYSDYVLLHVDLVRVRFSLGRPRES